MQKLFGSRSQAIQLSSDDEEDFVGDSNGMSSGFGCVSCLPQFTMMGGSGNIQLSAEDATLDDYLDPNTSTTIEPLLEEYNSQQRDNAFNGAALQDSQRFLTRNPFASSTPKPTTGNDLPTQHTFNSSNDNYEYQHDSYQEQQQHSFAGALPRVDFFLENDDNDAEFLSDHRISAVIGDSSKLASQFELFDAQDKTEQLLQDDHRQSIFLDPQGGKDEQNDDSTTAVMEPAQPFEIENDWPEALDMELTVGNAQQEQKFDTCSSERQQQMEMDNAEKTLTDIPTHTRTITSELDSMTTSPYNNDQTADGIAEEPKPLVDVSPENAGTRLDIDDLTSEMKSMNLSPGNNDYDMDTNTHADVSLEEDNISSAATDLPYLSNSPFIKSTVHASHISSCTQATDIKQDDTKDNEKADQNTKIIPTSKSASLTTSSPPSPMPTMSTENATSAFPSTGLPRTTIPVQSLDDSPMHPAPTTYVADHHTQHADDDDNGKPNIIRNSGEDTYKDDTTVYTSDASNATQSSVGSTVVETENNTNTSDGKRRSSVAAVAHSLLGDKLDDFTEKLAYIRKNIIMSLDDDDDEENDDYYGEDMTKLRQQQHQQLRRSRSGSMQQEMRRQSFDPSVSRLSGNVEQQQQQQQRRPLTRADTVGPRTHHRRSNSLMDGATSFAKIFQQMGGQHEGESNHQRHFSPSSFFASLAGPDIPPSSSSPQSESGSTHAVTASSSPLPQRSSSMSSPALTPSQQHQYPAVSRSATQLHASSTQQPSSRPYNNESLLHNVNEEENIDEEDLFDFSKMLAMGKNVRNMSEDLMGNGIRLFNDFSTRMKNANANRMAALEQPSSSSTTTNQQQHQQHQYYRQPQPRQEQQTSSMDQEFLLGDTYI